MIDNHQSTHSETHSHSTALQHRSITNAQKLEVRVFHLIKRLSFDTTRFHFLALFLATLEILQLCGVIINVSNIKHWDALFDFRVVQFLAIPISVASSQIYSWTSYFTILISSVCFIALLCLTTSAHSSSKLSSHSSVPFFTSPLVSVLTSSLTCLPLDSTPPLLFHPFFSLEDCWSIGGILIKIVSAVVIVALFLITLVFYTCAADVSPLSKRLWSRSTSLSHFWLFISKNVIVFSFFLFPFRVWLFRSLYILASIVVPVLFIRTIPFYKKQSNQYFCLSISQWPASSITLLANILISAKFSLSDRQSGLIVLVVWGLTSAILGLVFYWSVTNVYDKYSKKTAAYVNSSSKVQRVKPQVNQSVSVEVDSDTDDVSSSIDDVSLTADEVSGAVENVPVKYWFEIELLTRFLQPKPHKSKAQQVDVANHVIEHGIVTFPDSVDSYLFKCNFETFIKENHLSYISLNSLINNLDVDLTFRQRYLLFFYQKSSEALRRKSNTGEDYLDAKSSITFQKNFREVKELHQDCLEALSQFWNVLLSERVELSRLPLITDKLRVQKLKADTLFASLLGAFPDHKDLLLAYAIFCKDIKMDDELAGSIMESLELQSSTGSSDAQSQRSSVLSKSSFTKKRRRSRRRKGVDLSSSSNHDHHDLVSVLSRMIFGSFGLLFIVSLISFWFFSDTLHDVGNRAQQLLESSHVLAMSNKAIVEARMYSIFYNSTLEPHYRKEIVETAEHINYHARRIFMSADALTTTSSFICPRVNEAPLDRINDELINNFIRNPTITAFFYRNTSPPINEPSIINYWELVSSFASTAFNFISSFDSEVDVDQDRFFRFLTDNRRTLNIGGSVLWETILNSSQRFFDYTLLIILISLISSVVCLFFIALFGFYRVISKISWERQAVLNLFLWVPSVTCRSIVSELTVKIKNFGRTHQRDPDFEDISESNDVDESRLDQSNSVEEEPRTDDSVTVSIKSDGDVHDDLPVKYRFKFVPLTVVIVLILISLSLLFSFNSVSNSHEEYLTALTSGQYLENSAVELIVLDYILTSRIFGLVNSGDLFFYQSYWSFLNAGARETLIESLFYDYDVSNQIKTLIGDTSVFRDGLLYFDNIAQVLAAQVYQFNSNELHELGGFTYDLNSETTLSHDKIVYNDVDNWYSDLETDQMIADEEKLKVIRSTISSDRYNDVLLQSTRNQWSVLNLLDAHVEDNVARHFSLTSDRCWISVFLLPSLSYFFLFRFISIDSYIENHF
ncbi:hypothetical protein GEMRC1_009276 [Eukaryota sp. GEM-RC1]